ncbi:MAG TPA: trigger factor [Gemmatimonadales bacterium]|jgi:trigger factor|nr:trigger factor [Gemmatimonadales bacterium]
MPDILVKKTHTEPGETSLAVTVPPESVAAAEERATRAYQQRARLPGFRQGKAPAAVVRKKFAEDIRQQALQELVQQSWRVALEQEQLKPIADPHIHNLKWEQGAPVTFEFHVEVKPDLKLQRLGGFRLKRTVPAVSEAQIDAQLNEMRAQRAPWTPVAGEKPKPKDLVHVTIATREGGEAKDPQPYQVVLGEGRAIPDVEERIMGLLPGETVDATVRFPDDFAEEVKRGQTRDVRITLHEVKRQELAPFDDAFAREVGDFESLDALRRAVGEDLRKEAEREADARVRAELIEQLVAANNVTAPRPLVERALYVYAQAYDVPEDRWPTFAQEFRPVAEAQVRRDLVLDYVVEAQQLRATEAELDQRIQELAARRGMPAAQLYASLEKAKRLRDVERSITEEKVFAHLLSQSTVEHT